MPPPITAGDKISALSAVSSITDLDQFAINQGGVSKRLTVAQILNAVAAGYTLAGLPTAGNVGRFARVTDTARGLYRDNGIDWIKDIPYLNAQDYGIKVDGSTDNGPMLQDLFDDAEGKRIILPSGIIGIGTPVEWTTANWIIDGSSRVFSVFTPLAADIHVGSGPNAMFINKAGTLNAIIRNIRFHLTASAAFTGRAISAREGVSGEQAILSLVFENNWIDLSTAGGGFFYGGLIDCFFRGNQFESGGVAFETVGYLSNTSFVDNKTYVGKQFIISSASNGCRIQGLDLSAFVVGTALDFIDGENLLIDGVMMESIAPANTTDSQLLSLDNCDAILNNLKVDNYETLPAAIRGETKLMTLNDSIVIGSNIKGTYLKSATQNIQITGDSDVQLSQLDLSTCLTPEIGLSGSGKVKISNSKFKEGVSYSILPIAANSINLTLQDNEYDNPVTGGSVPCIIVESSGRTLIIDNNFIDGVAGAPTGWLSNLGAGIVLADGNNFEGVAAKVAAGSTGVIRFGLNTGLAQIYFVSAMPSTGSFNIGDVARLLAPVEAGSGGSKYIIEGYLRLTTGSGNVLNTDWFQMRVLTGN